ncbi:MAG: hypothetical protein DMF90_20530, partial [Acidobacteria bacterium]
NIHAVPKTNSEFNTGQPIQGMKTTHTFTTKEVMVPFKCDVHGWMNAYVGVLDHPYYAVSDASGAFELKSLPPGTYTIEAWHERLGATTQSVTRRRRRTSHQGGQVGLGGLLASPPWRPPLLGKKCFTASLSSSPPAPSFSSWPGAS